MYLSASEENDTKFLMFAQDRSGFGAVNLMLSMVANGACACVRACVRACARA